MPSAGKEKGKETTAEEENKGTVASMKLKDRPLEILEVVRSFLMSFFLTGGITLGKLQGQKNGDNYMIPPPPTVFP